jgi:glycosyltransferase involved in cell wall biosynthesis
MKFAFLFPRFKLLSGAEKLILKLSGALQIKGHHICILCHQFDSSCKPLLAGGVDLVETGKKIDFVSNRYLNAFFDYYRNKSLTKVLPDKVDAVCCFGPALTASQLLTQKKQFPVLYFCYEPPRFLYTDRNLILDRLGIMRYLVPPFLQLYQARDQSLVHNVNRVLTNSEFGRRQISDVYGVDSRVITHGLDPYRPAENRTQLRDSLGLSGQDIGVLTANYLHPRKRVDLFLEAVRLAGLSDSRIKGIVIGDGPERQALEKIAGNTSRFVGFIPEESIAGYFQSADIYLHTARLETFGLSVIEASANHLPVVSVNEGGPQETVLNGETGTLVESKPELLAKAIVALARDPAKRKSMGQRGYEYVRSKYSWESGAEDFLNALKEIL